MREISEDQLHVALNLLGSLLAEAEVAPISLVVAGGSALMTQKLITRRTHDVDVIAMEGGDVSAYPFPDFIRSAAAKVAQELDLDPNWLNNSMSLFLGRDQLPEWIWWNFDTRNYGKCLKISFVRREGLILLKLYAALNRDEARDIEDLVALNPSAEEVQRHLSWIFREILGQTTHPKLKTVLNHLGHGDLID